MRDMHAGIMFGVFYVKCENMESTNYAIICSCVCVNRVQFIMFAKVVVIVMFI